MSNIHLYDQIENLPEDLKKQASDFIAFLAEKAMKDKKKPEPKFGSGKGLFKMAPDFDEPLEDFKDYM